MADPADRPTAAAAAPAPAAAAPIVWIDAASTSRLEVPWPRRQELDPSVAHSCAAPEDLTLAVSHPWPYQCHPDPLGEKAGPIASLIGDATRLHQPLGRTLLFFDYMSVTQRPRTRAEEAAFDLALSMMPRLYLNADAVLHVELPLTPLHDDGEAFELSMPELRQATLAQLGAVGVQVVGGLPQKELFSFVEAIGGIGISNLGQLEGLLRSGDVPAEARVQMRRARYGLRNQTPGNERGWVFLERFCSMCKLALVPSSCIDRVAFSNSPSVLAQIRDGGLRLRAAAQQGEPALDAVVRQLVAELARKHFGGASADKLERPDRWDAKSPSAASRAAHSDGAGADADDAGVPAADDDDDHARAGGGARRARPLEGDCAVAAAVAVSASARSDGRERPLEGDAAVVARVMRSFASELPRHWQQERRRQRQRQLVLAVNRGDAAGVKELLDAGADPNEADAVTGATVVHAATSQRRVLLLRLLLRHGGGAAAQDASGNTAAHLVPQYSDAVTVELFAALADADADALSVRNAAGVSAFEHFAAWADRYSVAADGGSGPFAPAVALVESLRRKLPQLDIAAPPATSAPSMSTSSSTSMSTTAPVALTVTSTAAGNDVSPASVMARPQPSRRMEHEAFEHIVDGWASPVRLERWRPPSGTSVAVRVVWLQGMMPLPLTRDAVARVASRVCERRGAELTLVPLASGVVPAAAAFEDFVDRLYTLILSLQLPGPLVLVEDWQAVSGLPWRLRSRLAGVLLVNPASFYEEEVLESDTFRKVKQQCDTCMAAAQAQDFDALYSVARFGEFEHTKRLYLAEPQQPMWEHLEHMCRWISEKQISDFVNSLPPLTPPLPACVVAVSALGGPLTQQAPAKRLHRDYLPGSRLEYVANSFSAWFTEGDEVKDAVASLLDSVLVAVAGQ